MNVLVNDTSAVVKDSGTCSDDQTLPHARIRSNEDEMSAATLQRLTATTESIETSAPFNAPCYG